MSTTSAAQAGVAGAFDAAAPDFDDLGRVLWSPIGERAVDLVMPAPGDRVLDACCGSGASALPAAARVGRLGQVDAVDLSGGLLDALARRAEGVPQLHVHRADATAWERQGYHVVQCVLGVFFFPDMTAGTDHLVRRAVRGGTVGVTIWRRGAVEVPGRALAGALSDVLGGVDQPREEHLIDRINVADAFGAWLRDRGLDAVEVHTHELTLPATEELSWLLVTGSGFAGALRELDADQTERVRDRYLARLAQDGDEEIDATTLCGVGTRA